MNKSMDKIVSAQIEGMNYAAKLIEQYGGDEALRMIRTEIIHRNVVPLPISYTHDKISSILEKVLDYAKPTIMNKVFLLSLVVLRDEYEFGQKRIQRYIDRFMLKVECLLDPELTNLFWEDYEKQLKDELGIEVNIKWPN